jgi:hypothetical protein
MDRSTIDQFIWNGKGMNIDGNKMKNGTELELEWKDYGM